jgi:hypothetical protein
MMSNTDSRVPPQEPATHLPAPSVDAVQYEPPSLTPVGNLCDLLGKSGASQDFTYRRHNSGRS